MPTTTARSTALGEYRLLYDSDPNQFYAYYKDRFVSDSVSTPLSIKDFVFQNEIRAIISKRTSAVPVNNVQIEVLKNGEPDDNLTEWAKRWVGGRNFGDNKDLQSFLPGMLTNLEVDGEVALKMIISGGVPVVRRMSGQYLAIQVDKDNIFDVIGYQTEYTYTTQGEDGNDVDVDITDYVTNAYWLTTKDGVGEPVEHGYSFIPCVHIKREDIEGDPHGRSGISDLVEPQNDLNRCLTNIARANKYGPFGLYCTESDEADLLGDSVITVAPGSLVKTPIRKISGDGAMQCQFDEKKEVLDSMYRIAGISRNSADDTKKTDDTSGKALVILSAQGRRYVEQLIARLTSGISELCERALVMAGQISDDPATLKSIDVSVTFPSLDKEDPKMGMERADRLMSIGLENQALIELGYSEDKAAQLLSEREGLMGPPMVDVPDKIVNQDDIL